MDIEKQSLKELIHIRCLLEGIWRDTKESKEGTNFHHIKERATDEFNELFSEERDT